MSKGFLDSSLSLLKLSLISENLGEKRRWQDTEDLNMSLLRRDSSDVEFENLKMKI